MAPEAVAAVQGAGPGDQQQGAALVFSQQAGGAPGLGIAHRVRRVARVLLQFGGHWQHLAQQGVVRVARHHEPGKPAGDQKGELARGGRGGEAGVQSQAPEQVLGLGKGLAEFLFPIGVPGQYPGRKRAGWWV